MGLKKQIWRMLAVLMAFSLLIISVGAAPTAADISVQSERFNMSYVYFGNSSGYTGLVDDTKGALDDISPSYFDLNEDGTLKLTFAVDRKFVDDMHERGVRVTPFLSNHWNRQTGINALANKEQLSSQIVAAIAEYNLDGVNVDIENVTETERESYTDFVGLLRQKLPTGKSLSVAVAANPWNMTTGWHGSYDYIKLAEYSDYLMLMTYDEHYQGSEAGAVAGYPFVEKSIQTALEKIPEDKLVLGMAFYGRLWKQGTSNGGYGVSNYMVENLIAQYRGKVVYDSVERSPKATITILDSDTKPVVFGRTLEAGSYDIWYENQESIKSKLALVGKYDLKGTGSWSLGQETKSTWDYYSLWLDSLYFADVQNNWARQFILSVLNKGWMIGVSSSQFMPDSPVTRAQAAVVLVRALGIDTTAVSQSPSSFSDTERHWANIEIEAARLNGLVEGTGAGKYEPDKAMTREQMAVLLDRVLNMNIQAAATFYDVTPESSSWSYAAINRIASAGILLGYPDGGFHPKASITRGEMAALMDRSSSYIQE